jgi:beta-aspartyl-peptidase (threonine type)
MYGCNRSRKIFSWKRVVVNKFSLAIHGGAGTVPRELLTEDGSLPFKEGLKDALNEGHKILSKGGSALDAVTASIVNLENNILFNAGKGAVFSNSGKHELDASIMDGKNLEAGAVAAVENIKNPILLAKKVLTDSPHVLLCREGAKEFATIHNLEIVADDYFFSENRFKQFEEAKKADQIILDHGSEIEPKFGTVGAVALDQNGNIAAGTSTGGMTNKMYNRIGDSPIIGAGTYANNKTCAISCTGYGEYFMRTVAAYDISCLIEYKNFTLKDAIDEVLHNKLKEIGGKGGIIGLDANGSVYMTFSTSVMYRGSIDIDGNLFVGIL